MNKRKLEKGELGFVLVLGIFSILCFISSLLIFLKSPVLSSEGAVPLVTSSVLVLMFLLMLAELRSCERDRSSENALFSFLFPDKVGLIVLYCIVYAVLLGLIGFVASTFLFLLGSMLTLNRKQPIRLVVITVVILVCIIILFQYIFKVQLP